MTNLPYEERIKNRSIDWYYDICIQQYHFIIKSISANERYKEEIARLNKIIDEFEKIVNECSILGEYGTSRMFIEKDYLLNKLKELKEEGKSQEIPLFEGTMEQLDNLTILKEEGK